MPCICSRWRRRAHARLMVNPGRRQALLGAPMPAAVMTVLEAEPPAETPAP